MLSKVAKANKQAQVLNLNLGTKFLLDFCKLNNKNIHTFLTDGVSKDKQIFLNNFSKFNHTKNFNNNFSSSLHKFSYQKFSTSNPGGPTREEQSITDMHKYISSFTGKKFDRFEDTLLVDNRLLGKLSSSSGMYPVYKSNIGYKIIKVLLLQIIMVIPILFLLYYSVQSTNKELALYYINKSTKTYVAIKASVILISLFILNLLRKNNLYKIWNYVKKIELSKDLNNLQITTFTNKVFQPKLKDMYFYYNFSSPYISHKSMSKVEDTLIFGIKDKQYIIPLENSTIQSKDLLSICLRGYSIKYEKKETEK
jgi:hypothetical protein